jgi:multiple sugar transport system substrate-binding protein
MKSRKYLSLLAVPMVLGLLTACGETTSTSKEQTTTSQTPTTTETSTEETYVPKVKTATTIYFWNTLGEQFTSTINGFIEGFKKLETNVTVEVVKQTGSYNDLKTKVVNGFSVDNYPDLVQCYPDHVAEYIDYEKALNLQPFIDNADYGWTAEDKADLIPAYLAEGRGFAKEGTYVVPFQKSTEAMFYNEDILLNTTIAQGIVTAYASLGKGDTLNNGNPISASYLSNLTWEELFNKLCPAIEAYNASLPEAEKILKTGEAYHSIFAYDSDDNLFITLAQQYGYGYTSVDKVTGKGKADFNNAEMKGLAATFNAAAKKGYIISKGSAGNNYTNTYFTKQNTLFSVGSTGGVSYQFSKDNPMNVGVSIIPHAEGKEKAVISQGPGLTMLDHNDENRALASWLFYKYMVNKENSLTWMLNSGYQGIRLSNFTSEEYLDKCDISSKDPKSAERLYAKASTYVPTTSNYLFTSPVFVGSSTCRTVVGGLMTKILTPTNDIKDVDTWFQDAYDTANIAIK